MAMVEGEKVVTYVHNAAATDMGTIGVLVAFSGADEAFGRQVAMHIAAANPAEAGSAPPPPRPPPAPTTTALAVAPAPAPAPTPRAPPRAQYAAAATGSATASLEAARAALVRKLDETVAALAESPPPASALVDAVAKCADALAATERALKA